MNARRHAFSAALAVALLSAACLGTAAQAHAVPAQPAPIAECFPPSLSGGAAVCVPFTEFLQNLLTGSANGSGKAS